MSTSPGRRFAILTESDPRGVLPSMNRAMSRPPSHPSVGEAGDARGQNAPLRFWLFAATGLAVPLFAFAPFRLAGERVDLAILLATAYLLLSLPTLARSLREDRARALFAGAAIAVPLLALIPARDPTFSLIHFARSLAHWWIISGFFLAAGTLAPAEGHRRLFIRLNLAAGIVVAAFAVYQAFGHARGWPGAGDRLLPFQRSPFMILGYGDYVRPSSFFLEPRYMGGYLAWIALLALAASVSGQSGVRPILPIAAFSCAVFGVAISLSWGAYADLLAILCAAALQVRSPSRDARLRLYRLGAALAVVVLVAGATPLRQALVGRLERLSHTPIDPAVSVRDPDSLHSRVINLRHTVLLFETAPVTGIGIGQFRVRTGATPGSFEESPWCGWAASAALFGLLGPLLVAAGPLLVLRASRWRPDLLAAGTVALAAVDQLHSASFIDLRWWFPLATALVLCQGKGSDAAEVLAAEAPATS